MGLADVLFALGIPYNSEEGFKFIGKVTEFLTYYAMYSSVERAKERGVFPFYEITSYRKGEMPIEGFYHKELWSLDWEELKERILKYGIRNVEVTSIAPTGSLSMFFDVSGGIEPQFSLVFEKRVTIGSFFYTDIEFERQLKKEGLYKDEILKKIVENGGSLQGIEEIPERLRKIFVTALDIPWWDHIRAQAVAQLWITTSISKTINMPSFASVEDVLEAYIAAYKMGCKGITIYREGSKSKQVLYAPSQAEEKRIIEALKLVSNDTVKIMKKLGLKEPRWIVELKRSGKILKENESKKIEKCPNCGSEKLVYQAGCVTCLECGWSACIIS
jgi:ribonucleoside-diphosphate reductase alpha chain